MLHPLYVSGGDAIGPRTTNQTEPFTFRDQCKFYVIHYESNVMHDYWKMKTKRTDIFNLDSITKGIISLSLQLTNNDQISWRKTQEEVSRKLPNQLPAYIYDWLRLHLSNVTNEIRMSPKSRSNILVLCVQWEIRYKQSNINVKLESHDAISKRCFYH